MAIAAQRLEDHGGAMKMRAVASMHAHARESGSVINPSGRGLVRDEIAAGLNIAPGDARALMEEAVPLVQQFPATLARLQEGRITARHATALVQASYGIDEATAAKV